MEFSPVSALGSFLVLLSVILRHYDSPGRMTATAAYLCLRFARQLVAVAGPLALVMLIITAIIIFYCLLMIISDIAEEGEVWRLPLAFAGFVLDFHFMPDIVQ